MGFIHWAWLRDAHEPAWRDLEETTGPVPHRCLVEIVRGLGIEHPPPLCATFNDQLGIAFFLEEKAAETAEAVRPELRLAAASRSALKSRGW